MLVPPPPINADDLIPGKRFFFFLIGIDGHSQLFVSIRAYRYRPLRKTPEINHAAYKEPGLIWSLHWGGGLKGGNSGLRFRLRYSQSEGFQTKNNLSPPEMPDSTGRFGCPPNRHTRENVLRVDSIMSELGLCAP